MIRTCVLAATFAALLWSVPVALPAAQTAPPPAAAATAEAARGGIGLQVVPVATGELVVLKVVEGSPAQKVGILPGDLIRTVNGHSLRGSKFEDVAKKWLWGEVGKPVEITLVRPGQTGNLRLTLTRVALRPEENATPEVRMLAPAAEGKKK